MHSNAELKWHYHPARGWINDPNGLIDFHGQYHVFYQHTPTSERPPALVWGHAVTRDFLHWEEKAPAIVNDRDYDISGVWSGTAIEKDGVLYAFYTSADAEGRQTISVSISRDGETFEKYAGNPILRDYPPEGSADFRDPAVCEYRGSYYMLIGSAYPDGSGGNLLLYQSDDLLSWRYVSVLRDYPGTDSCECPSIVPTEDGCLIAVSVRPKDAPLYFDVMAGDFDGHGFTPRLTSRFQKGPDEYAGQIFRDKKGRLILISWVSGWHYQPEKCVGCLSLPLELTIEKDHIRAYPVEEVRHLLDENDTVTDAYVTERFVDRGAEVHIRLTL